MPKPTKSAPTAIDHARRSLIALLADRFAKNAHRHRGIRWLDVLARLDANVAAIDALARMWDPLESTCRHASLSIL